MSGTHCSHRWAHNEDPDKTGKTGNMHFHGMSFYSYGTVIAVKYPKRKTVVFAGQGIYNSPSTAGHKSWARGALPSEWNTLTVDCDQYGHRLESMEGIRKCHDEMKKTLAGKLKAVAVSRAGKSRVCRFKEYNYYRKSINEIGAFVGRKEIPEAVLDDGLIERVKEEAARQKAAEARAYALREEAARKRREKDMLKERENVELWRKREFNGSAWQFSGTYLRMSKCGKFVETSRGAVVPREDALKLLKACRIYVRTKPEVTLYPKEDVGIGDYRVYCVDANGTATVGCHTLTLEEMERCFADAVAASDDPAMLLMAVE